jgi:large subunit ribosomal protein L30
MATAGTTIRIELIHSGIGFDQTQKDTLRGLGLRKRHKIVELKDTPQIRGMVYKVRHLVRVLEGKAVVKPSPWKGVIIVPGPKTEPKAAKKVKAKKGGPRMKSPKAAAAKKGK